MRIAIAGKGGAGKTTLAATMARRFAQRGFTVNALDGDPNPNLAAALGVEPGAASRLERIPDDALESREDPEHGRSLHLRQPLSEVVEEHGVIGPDGVRVLNMTGLLGAGKGCICGQHAAVRDVMGELDGDPREVTLLDTEASLEHMSRGTLRHVDVLVIVAEPYFRALETMRRMAPLARDLGILEVFAIANKVRTPDDEAAIREYAASVPLGLLASVPWDDAIAEADRANRALLDHQPASPAVMAIDAAVEELAIRAGGPREAAA